MSSAPAHPGAVWARFARLFVATAAAFAALLFAFIVAVDPYGIFASPHRAPSPIMDLNQRFMYPQIVRSGRYDSAVFGTSTLRLLDPDELSRLFGGRFANLAMNAATPWEQAQMASLFLRTVPAPKTLIFGLDSTWCEPDADRKKLTFRAFPPWLYDDAGWRDIRHELDLKSFEIALRTASARLGLARARLPENGFEIFTPPEEHYDAARARAHIWGGAAPHDGSPVSEPVDAAARAGWHYPALPWLDGILADVPAGTRIVLLFPPVHIAQQPRPGSVAAAREADCKDAIRALAERRGATLVDFRLKSPVTADDNNYWDGLHYRLPIAARIARDLHQVSEGTSRAADGFFRVLTRTPNDPR